MTTPNPHGWKPATLAVREAVDKSAYGENSEALYITSGFVQPDAQTMAKRFLDEEPGYTYARYSNPTVTSMERRLAALEGMEAAVGAGSGMGAILMLCLGLLKTGDHVVCSRSVFGSTLKLIGTQMAQFGVECTLVSQTDVDEWARALKPRTKLLFAETPTNPLTEVCDLAALAELAHRSGALLAVDNSFCSPALQRPVEFGADVVIHSSTKYLDGQGRVIAGALCSSHELAQTRFMPALKCGGMSLSPFNAWVVLKGMETLGIRMKAQSEQALQLAQWLEAQPQIKRVYYPGLASHPQHALAMRQQGGVGGAVLSFVLKGTTPEIARANAWTVVDQTQICSRTANVGDVKTILTHPATTSHGRLTEEMRQACGITQGLLRLAVGLEDLEDLKEDLSRGLALIAT